MIIAVLGATGPSGLHFVSQALASGHVVRALVRNPQKFDQDLRENKNLEIIPDVNIFCSDNLEKGFSGSDVVVSCLGTRPTLTPFGAEIRFYSESIKSITEAMRRSHVTRLVAMTSWYTDDDPNYGFFVRWILKPMFIGRNLDDMQRMEQYVEENCQDLTYTIVRPPGLGYGGPTDREINEQIGGQCVKDFPKVSRTTERGDVARFLLKTLTCGAYDRKIVAIVT